MNTFLHLHDSELCHSFAIGPGRTLELASSASSSCEQRGCDAPSTEEGYSGGRLWASADTGRQAPPLPRRASSSRGKVPVGASCRRGKLQTGPLATRGGHRAGLSLFAIALTRQRAPWSFERLREIVRSRLSLSSYFTVELLQLELHRTRCCPMSGLLFAGFLQYF